MTANTIAHELGHAFGIHRNEVIDANTNIKSKTLNEYLDAFAHSEGDAGLAQYQTYIENKNNVNINNAGFGGNNSFEMYHADILKAAKGIVDDKNINPYGEAIFSDKYNTIEGYAIRKRMAEEMGKIMRNKSPSSQGGQGEDALTYDEDGIINFLKVRTTLDEAFSGQEYIATQRIEDGLARGENLLSLLLGQKGLKDLAQSVQFSRENGKDNITFHVTYHNEEQGRRYEISTSHDKEGIPWANTASYDNNNKKVREVNVTKQDNGDSFITLTDKIDYDNTGKMVLSTIYKEVSYKEESGSEYKSIKTETEIETDGSFYTKVTQTDWNNRKTIFEISDGKHTHIESRSEQTNDPSGQSTITHTEIIDKDTNSREITESTDDNKTKTSTTNRFEPNENGGNDFVKRTETTESSSSKTIIETNYKDSTRTITVNNNIDGTTTIIERDYDTGNGIKFDPENGAYNWKTTVRNNNSGESWSSSGRFDPADPDNSSLPPGTGNNGNGNENGNNGNANENGNNGNANENGNNGNGNENGGNENGNNPANPGGLPVCTILGAFAGGFAGGVAGGPLGALLGAGVGAQHGAKACGEPNPWKPFFPPMALDPLSLDLNGDGKIGTLPLARGVHFDMDNSGFAEKLSWIAPEDGLLVNLADGAMRVSNGSQLLGNETRLPSGELAADGFAALAALDDNGDGRVDAQDVAFAHLRIWQNKDSDGIASADELFALEALGIVSLATAYDAATWTDANGVEHRGEGAFATQDAGGLMQTLWFTADKVDSVAVDVHHGTSAGLPEAVTRLPNAAGFGNVDTLHRAMNADADLRALVEAFVAEAEPAARQALTEQILRRWAKADAVTGTRGALDARDLAVLEAFWGQPTGAYARSVAQVYEGLKSLLHAQLSLQSHYREWYGLAQFRVQHGAWEINDTALADTIAQRFGAGSVNAATVGDFLDAVQGLTPGNAALLQHLTVSVRQASAQLPQESRSALHEVIHRGDDHIALADGEDFVNAGAGNDRIDGNAGSNVIMDGAGNDTVHAGAGDDVLVSGRGDDSLDGGSGNDVYRIGGQPGHDTIHNVDNDPGRHDEIHLLDRDMTEVDISRVNNDLLIRSHDGDSSVTVHDHFNGAPVDAVRFSDDMVFDRAFLDKVARANSDPDYPDPTDWVENEQHDLDALLHRLAHGAAEDNHTGLSGWNRLLDRLTQDANSPSDIGDVDRLIEQMERGTTGKNATPPHQYDHHAHGTGGAHEHIDRLIDTWAGI